MPTYTAVVKIIVSAMSQGEALQEIEKRVRAQGNAEDIPARVTETISIKERE